MLENIDKKCSVAFFEITTEKFANTKVGKTVYSEPSKFPAIEIDMTYVADVSAINFARLTAMAKDAAGEMLSDVRVKDIYTQDGTSAITIRFAFLSTERTLTKQELAPLCEKINEALAAEDIVLKA